MAAKLKDKTDIDHHGPKYILIICHLPDPPTFSLPTTFKHQSGRCETRCLLYSLYLCACILAEKSIHIGGEEEDTKQVGVKQEVYCTLCTCVPASWQRRAAR